MYAYMIAEINYIYILVGSMLQVQWTSVNGAGTFTVNGTQFVLRQVHWHSPTEHAINGTRLISKPIIFL